MIKTPAPPEPDTLSRVYLSRFPFRMMSYIGALSKAKSSMRRFFVPGARPLGNCGTRR